MNRKLYTSLILLMSFSLIGIILMQGYWIYSSWKNKEEELRMKKDLLNKTASTRKNLVEKA